VRGGVRDRFTYLVLCKRAEVAGPPSGADKSMALFSLDDEAGGYIHVYMHRQAGRQAT
jgi:hypothetical protein